MENDPYAPPTQNLETGRDEGHFHTTSGPGRLRRGSVGIDGLEARRLSNDDGYSNPTTEESVELDDMVSESGLSDDEETGLTSKERSERRRRRKKRTHLDARIADDLDVKVSKEEKKLADISVVRKLLVNATLIGSWYFFSLSISLYNKWMFSPEHLDFHFPLFTTSLHMLVQFSLASLLLYIFPRLRPVPPPATSPTSPPKPLVTRFFYLTRLVPCGSATSLDIGLGNMSLKFITLTFYTMCKSSALAFVLLFAFIFRLETPSWKLILIIATMTAGVVMMVAGETAFDALGFALIISSAFFSGFRWGLTQILLLRHPATSNPFATLFFLAPIMFVTLTTIALPVEGPAKIIAGIGVLADKKGSLYGILILLFPGVLAFCMTSSEFALLQRTSVVTLSICGIFKEVVTISAAGIVFHDQLTPINVSGLVVTIGSIAAYNYLKITKMRQEARKEVIEHEALVHDVDGQPGSSSDAINDSFAPLLGDEPGMDPRPRLRLDSEERAAKAHIPRLTTDNRRDESPGSGSLRSSNGTASPLKKTRNVD